MKKLLIVAMLIGVGAWVYNTQMTGKKGDGRLMTTAGVPMGASVEEVEKTLGPALNVLPNFGRELRIYQGKSGTKYMLIFDQDVLVEVQK